MVEVPNSLPEVATPVAEVASTSPGVLAEQAAVKSAGAGEVLSSVGQAAIPVLGLAAYAGIVWWSLKTMVTGKNQFPGFKKK